jgi:hypothetical protein
MVGPAALFEKGLVQNKQAVAMKYHTDHNYGKVKDFNKVPQG